MSNCWVSGSCRRTSTASKQTRNRSYRRMSGTKNSSATVPLHDTIASIWIGVWMHIRPKGPTCFRLTLSVARPPPNGHMFLRCRDAAKSAFAARRRVLRTCSEFTLSALSEWVVANPSLQRSCSIDDHRSHPLSAPRQLVRIIWFNKWCHLVAKFFAPCLHLVPVLEEPFH